MRNILLITHPEVIIDQNRPIEEWLLSKKGLERVNGLLQQVIWHDVDVIYTSPEMKAYIVAEMAAIKFDIPYDVKHDLVEIDRSSTGYLPYAEYMETVKRFYEQPHENVRGWESADHAMHRIAKCVEMISADEPGKTCALVGHGAAFTLLLCSILGRPPSYGMDPGKVGCYAEVDWNEKKILTTWMQY
jgi:broad specificity phosphatase PhoE